MSEFSRRTFKLKTDTGWIPDADACKRYGRTDLLMMELRGEGRRVFLSGFRADGHTVQRFNTLLQKGYVAVSGEPGEKISYR